VELVAPQLGETIYGPAAGSVGFLPQAFDYLRDPNADLAIEQDERLKTRMFFGNEKGRAYAARFDE